MLFQFTRGKPIKEQKLFDTILIAWAKVVEGMMSGWKAPQVITKLIRNIGLHQRKHGCLVVYLKHHVLIFYM